MKNYLLRLFLVAGILTACSSKDSGNEIPELPKPGPTDVSALTDKNLETYYEANGSNISFILTRTNNETFSAYGVYSGADMEDPVSWKLSGSEDQQNWVDLDQRSNLEFCARFQKMVFSLKNPVGHKYLKFEIQPKNGVKTRIAELEFYQTDPNNNWTKFNYPSIVFKDEASSSLGSLYYNQMVQNKTDYIQNHAKEVAKILYFSDQDPIVNIRTINYNLKNYNGVSDKAGQAPNVTINYSTQHIEQCYKNSMFTLDYETRGVLFHELTHAYQYEPKGVGDYGSQDKVFWSFVEGLADAVRIQAGFVSIKERKTGGRWLDGYKTTGFFLHWLTTKDADAIRKFNKSAYTLNPWSYNEAMKYIFGEEATIIALWSEYQLFLEK